MPDASSKPLEERLLAEIRDVTRKIQELELERRGLERLLTRLRREEVSNQEVGRKNSARRILVEKAVLDRLTLAAGKSVATHDLWRAANDIELNLNQSTFRSHLHRMKAKGLIEAGHLQGRWQLPPSGDQPSGGERGQRASLA